MSADVDATAPTIAVIGAGVMGETLISGLVRGGHEPSAWSTTSPPSPWPTPWPSS